MANPLPIPAPNAVVDAEGLVAADIPCRKCSYNLRSLRVMGRCPECGTPVGLSIQGDHLRFCDPAWLARVAMGLGIMFVASLVGTTLTVVSPITTILRFGPLVGPEFMAVVALVGLVGTWMMTAPDPGAVAERPGVDARRFARWAVAVALLGNITALLRAQLTSLGGTFPLFLLVYLLFAAVAVVAEWAKYTYIAQLASRVPDDALARSARRLRVIFPVARIVVMVPLLIALMTQLGLRWVGGVWLPAVVYLAGLCILAFCAISGLALVLRFRKVIGREAVVAKEIWRREMPTGG